MIVRIVVVVFLWGLQSSAVFGGLLFDDRTVEVAAAPDASEIVVKFPFEVKGKKDVTIASYDAPCSCLSAQISDGGRLVWKPGEKGVVKGVFTLGTFKGTVEKQIVLQLKGVSSVIKLSMAVTIPELVKIEPPTLAWAIGGEPDTKSFKITMHHDKPIKLLEAALSNEQFESELVTVREGEEYELRVTPKSMASRSLGMVRLRTDSTMKRHQRYQAFVMIRQGLPAAIPVSPKSN